MLQLKGYDIQVSRGDTLSLRVALTGGTLPEGTSLLFTVRANPQDKEALVEKRYVPDADGAILIYLHSREMDMPPGRYVWDLRAILPPEGQGEAAVATPMCPAVFEVKEVVGHV